MRICVKLKPLAILQKIFGWLIVIEAAKSGMEPAAVLLGYTLGILLCELADVWYKLIYKYEQAIEKSAY